MLCQQFNSVRLYFVRSSPSSASPGGRGRPDAMRSTPSQRAAGKRARRFLAATSVPAIRVAQPYARRICAPDRCHPHAPANRRGSDKRMSRERFPGVRSGGGRRPRLSANFAVLRSDKVRCSRTELLLAPLALGG